MSDYTPPPWEYVTEITYLDDYPYSKAHRIKIGKETLTIYCHAYGWEGEAEIVTKSNLIAAAPDLLEACKAGLKDYEVFCKTCGEDCDECTANGPKTQLEKAIAKAEGKAVG